MYHSVIEKPSLHVGLLMGPLGLSLLLLTGCGGQYSAKGDGEQGNKRASVVRLPPTVRSSFAAG